MAPESVWPFNYFQEINESELPNVYLSIKKTCIIASINIIIIILSFMLLDLMLLLLHFDS